MKRIFAMIAGVAMLMAAGTAMAAGTNTMTVSANVVGTCKFSAATSTLGFGNLDPALTTDATAAVNVAFWCTKGATYTVGDDGGLYNVGGPRMQHATDPTQFIPYTISYTNTGTGAGKTTAANLAVSGLVANADYVNALAGNYQDTVTVTITP
ncbi:MAG: spore coat protein U domain-containing protein [Thermodesulfobacteriota bacterium]